MWNKLEKAELALASVFKQLPALPAKVKKPIVNYAWVAVIVTAVLGAIMVVNLFRGLYAVDSLGGLAALFGGSVDLIGLRIEIYLMIAVWVVVVALQVMAVKLLKEKQYRGWQYVLYAAVLTFVFTLLALILSLYMSGSSVISVLLSAAAVYVLFQVRDYFAGHKVVGGAKK